MILDTSTRFLYQQCQTEFRHVMYVLSRIGFGHIRRNLHSWCPGPRICMAQLLSQRALFLLDLSREFTRLGSMSRYLERPVDPTCNTIRKRARVSQIPPGRKGSVFRLAATASRFVQPPPDSPFLHFLACLHGACWGSWFVEGVVGGGQDL